VNIRTVAISASFVAKVPKYHYDGEGLLAEKGSNE
jgi:hypothetical protein